LCRELNSVDMDIVGVGGSNSYHSTYPQVKFLVTRILDKKITLFYFYFFFGTIFYFCIKHYLLLLGNKNIIIIFGKKKNPYFSHKKKTHISNRTIGCIRPIIY
jgi:hypothetical protein